MGKDVVQYSVLIDLRPPLDRLIEHHEEEPVLGGLEEGLQELGSIELAWFRPCCRHRASWPNSGEDAFSQEVVGARSPCLLAHNPPVLLRAVDLSIVGVGPGRPDGHCV